MIRHHHFEARIIALGGMAKLVERRAGAVGDEG